MESDSITQIYCWGLGVEGQLGTGLQSTSATPSKSQLSLSILDISCGGQFSAAVSTQKVLYMWGSNKKFKLGLGPNELNFPLPTMVKTKTPIVAVACGDWHSLIVDQEGLLYSVGFNKHGCLGLEDCFDRTNFEWVESLPDKVKKVSAGRNLSLVLTSADQVLSAGKGGLNGNSGADQARFEEIKAFAGDKVREFSAGFSCCACVDEKGGIFTWGSGVDYQLGHGDTVDRVSPKQIDRLKGIFIVNVCCSRGDRHCHMGCVDSEGGVYSWGSGYKGKLGHNSLEDEKWPRRIEFFRERNVKAASFITGGIHSGVVSEDGRLFTFGCGSDGRLGHPELGSHRYLYKEKVPKAVERLVGMKVLKACSSYYHMVALVKP